MRKKRRKLKWKNIIILIIILICLIFLIISIKDIIKWRIDSNKIDKQLNEIQEIVEIEEVEETEEVEIIQQDEEIPQANPYWDYIKMNLINVNFNELKKINSNTKGWIQVNGTNINYPFVQAKDNKYYLTHSFDKSYNSAGWVFLDYRNNINSLSKNTIIYAHGRLDTTMFGSLKSILKSGWLNNSNNYIVKLSTETENTLWQVFSVYHIPTTSDYIRTEFSSNEDFNTWTSILINRSSYNFNTNINENDNVLTLSTCYNDNEKVVLHAKLIKKETR
ncbi:MAG: class B sortase [Bacilli bacterium]|nr:class B sortase [Bacilli bacterium]MBQ3511822.1 class B sortase [Bacilli bacterium]